MATLRSLFLMPTSWAKGSLGIEFVAKKFALLKAKYFLAAKNNSIKRKTEKMEVLTMRMKRQLSMDFHSIRPSLYKRKRYISLAVVMKI